MCKPNEISGTRSDIHRAVPALSPATITPELCAGIVGGLQIGIAVFKQESDQDGANDLVLVMANAAAERISGYPLSTLIGHRRSDIGAPPDLNEAYTRALRTGEPVVVGDLSMPCDRVWSGYVFPLPDRRVALAFEDVTKTRKLGQSLQESENHYRSIFEASHDAIVVIDVRDGRVLDANPAAIQLYESEQLVGAQAVAFSSDQAKTQERIARIGREGTLRYETTHRLPTGREIFVEGNATLIDNDGWPAILVVTRDVTLRKQIEIQQYEAAEFGFRALHEGDTARLFDDACYTVRDVLRGDIATIYRHEQSEQQFVRAAQTDTSTPLSLTVPDDPTRTLGFVHSQSRAVSFDDLECETRFRAPGLMGKVRSGIAAPVRGNTIDFGVMSLVFRGQRSFAEHDVAFVQTIANSLADAIERLEAEQALKEREKHLQLIVSRLVDAKTYGENLIDSANVMIIENDTEGQVRLVNRAFENLTGRSRHAIVGTSVFDLFTDGLRDWRANAVARRDAEAGGEPVALGEQETESVIIAADRSLRILRLRSNDVWRNGVIIGTIFFGVDVTDSIAAEAAKARLQSQVLSAAEEWRNTFDSVVSPILIVDAAGTIGRANRAATELTGRTFQELVGTSMDSLPPAEPWSTAIALAERTRTGGLRATAGEARDAAGHAWNISVMPLDIAGHKSRSVIVVLSDISSIVDLQESLRMNERMSAMGQLMAGVAHEVRNPLFGISAALDAFEVEFGQTAEFEEYIQRLRSDTDRLRRLMNDLLDYGRPSALRREVQPFAPLAERAMAVCLPQAREKKVELRLRIEEPLPVVAFDHDRMLQVLTNVIQNAIAFTAKESTVLIEARADGPDLVCAVSDRGPGFRAEDIPHVFNPFFTRRRGGTGLGLAIVQRIVGDHGGSVTVRNLASGGAIVEMRFR
jgi:PAS domain S-box-containing protein